MHSRRQLYIDLRALGVAPGSVVMVHASVRAVGEVAGGPDEIHLALKDAVTDAGTLLVDGYLAATANQGGRVGNAWSHLFSARGLLAFARPVMERVALDPDATVALREQAARMTSPR